LAYKKYIGTLEKIGGVMVYIHTFVLPDQRILEVEVTKESFEWLSHPQNVPRILDAQIMPVSLQNKGE
jgi:hypothetical protein